MSNLTPDQELDLLWHESKAGSGYQCILDANRERRRANHYRFWTLLLSCLFLLACLGLRAENQELGFAAAELNLANAQIRSDQAHFQKQNDCLKSDLTRQIEEGARIGEDLAR
jgi:hypothetical protein